MSVIQIFIATHNRPILVISAIQSALKQNFDSFEVIVSDNSTNEETGEVIKQFEDDRLIYKRRTPILSSSDHFNAILQDVTSDYFMIFHDDDIMYFNMLKYLFDIISERKEIIAVGANARVLENGKVKRNKFFHSLKSDTTIYDLDQIIKAYSIPGFVPFPSYLYRREVAQKLQFNPDHGGKHCDAAFIMDILTLGSIIFVAKPLMDYNIHENQDSKFYDFIDGLKLIKYITKLSRYQKNHPIIRRFRIQNIYAELKYLLLSNNISVFSKKYYHLTKLLLKYSVTEYFPKIIFLTAYHKLCKTREMH